MQWDEEEDAEQLAPSKIVRVHCTYNIERQNPEMYESCNLLYGSTLR